MENNIKFLAMKIGDILEDGSMYGQTFSGDNYKGEYPCSKKGDTYGDFYERCEKAKEEGFHLGDLSWSDWHSYCLGFPGNEEYRQDEEM